eukprot:CAMPEP_0181213324 /NCGR_PEP_ID=MMETSP1096-20121128/24838_1 /TAXON_ID=156174 ORGANISM="Chrysochromulina ericina, Strain CCMP281" /NCGR_SAMPLE_ID=MMETSP1096 /ASSEMBLY_ACC=CAM_ASM_000453 /LENGTH=51 /DNA_ID=CAMNT_0023304943 /DNA_START=689 /DNA_END=841 /DNA_ORIENTATION=+
MADGGVVASSSSGAAVAGFAGRVCPRGAFFFFFGAMDGAMDGASVQWTMRR